MKNWNQCLLGPCLVAVLGWGAVAAEKDLAQPLFTNAASATLEALVIEVVDQGPGLPDDVQATLRDQEPSSAPHSIAPGHGLGLRIVQRVARLHEGRLEWRADQPGGSVFRLLLPQASLD